MRNIRQEFIKEILDTLKVPAGAFNVQLVSDEIGHIPDNKLREFHRELFGTQHAYLSGMDKIMKVAEKYKPVVIDNDEVKAKQLISAVETMSSILYDICNKSGESFNDYVRKYAFNNVSTESRQILENVAPYNSLSELVINISHYADANVQLKAFVRAVKYSSNQQVLAPSVRKAIQS